MVSALKVGSISWALVGLLLLGASQAEALTPRLSSATGVEAGQTVVIQLRTEGTAAHTPFQIESVDATFSYDPAMLTFVTARAGSALTGGSTSPVILSHAANGEVTVAVAVVDPRPLVEGGLLLELEFTVMPALSGTTLLGLGDLSLNENAISATAADVPEGDGVVDAQAAIMQSSLPTLIIVICSRPGSTCR